LEGKTSNPARRGGLGGFVAAMLEARDVARPGPASRSEIRRATRLNWTAVPCGSDAATAARHSREYFDGIERYRYLTQPWTAEAIDRLDLDGRRVLELGFGAGTDHLRLARRAGTCVGLDLTPQSCAETRARFALHGRAPRLVLADIEALPFPDGAFDLVYSFGTIHHTPDVAGVIREIARVLRPGGRAWVAVYNSRSVFFWWSVFFYRYLLRGGWRRRSLRAQLSLLEHPNDREDLVVLLHTRLEMASLFRAAGFAKVGAHVTHLVPADIVGLDVLLRNPARPRSWLSWLGRLLGWYVVVEARR
jgi:ubiquinone/menaquinone biosynthesis C-methylase UbiE